MSTITIWADIGCPWSYVTLLRLHRVRDHLNAERVEFDVRALPLEFVDNDAPSPARRRYEMAALAQHEHTAFSAYQQRMWPTTLLPAFEAQKWGYSQGQHIGEQFDLAIRRGLFLHFHNISMRHELLTIAESERLEPTALAAALDDGRFRKDITADFEAAQESNIDESATVVLGDGEVHVNPGMSVEWIRDIPIITADHPSVYEEIIRTATLDD
jgi:predicted DsbA family dithiol-disulfide isomerase